MLDWVHWMTAQGTVVDSSAEGGPQAPLVTLNVSSEGATANRVTLSSTRDGPEVTHADGPKCAPESFMLPPLQGSSCGDTAVNVGAAKPADGPRLTQ